ncbi:MAG: adenylate/guanylate cyclase domain-containing protein [Spirochaetaceae bacterium]
MQVRTKIIAVVLPLLIGALIVTGSSAFFVATNAVSRVTTEFLDFKADQLEQYIEGEWQILLENGLTDRADILLAVQAGIEIYARSVLRSETEVIFAVDSDERIAMATSRIQLQPQEMAALWDLPSTPAREQIEITVDGVERVAARIDFEPFGWRVFVTETRETFYRDLDQITTRTAFVTVASALVTVMVLFFVVRRLTKPVSHVVRAMRSIIASNDLTAKVRVHFQDEIGEMSQTFNVMISELDKAYSRIKRYAFEAVLAQKREHKIRTIFQKYVPQELIDRFFANPESMLVGENRELAVLFSDIRGFTSISESMPPDVLVASLNRYFSIMVELIMERGGVIDKYIGDAIMAFFGAPVSGENDAMAALDAGMVMVESVDVFNQEQRRLGLPEFRIGVGINYGLVTVGNIGTERKMDYTVIGDMVNVASRLEGLTKPYRQPLIFSELLRERVGGELLTRLVDTVAVKGRKGGLRIYTAKLSLTDAERRAWALHNNAMERYFERDFSEAERIFEQVAADVPDDPLCAMMIDRCRRYQVSPPPEEWNGVEVMTEK